MQGVITDIQRFSIHDGPGIRTTVFLKGCNLRCRWCHNPETLRLQPELQFFPQRCIGCSACLAACNQGAHRLGNGQRVFQRGLCQACGACAKTCYAQALVMVGRYMQADEVLAEVMQDAPFYSQSGGGVTISGGEPLLQQAFTLAILQLCKEQSLHTAIETNLAWPWERVSPVLPYTDLIMCDIKAADLDLHRAWTGVPNTFILANIKRLAEVKQPVIIRTPVISGVNDTRHEIGRIAQIAATLPNLLYYELLPYHPMAAGKYAALGLENTGADLRRPEQSLLESLADCARSAAITVRLGGS